MAFFYIFVFFMAVAGYFFLVAPKMGSSVNRPKKPHGLINSPSKKIKRNIPPYDPYMHDYSHDKAPWDRYF